MQPSEAWVYPRFGVARLPIVNLVGQVHRNMTYHRLQSRTLQRAGKHQIRIITS